MAIDVAGVIVLIGVRDSVTDKIEKVVFSYIAATIVDGYGMADDVNFYDGPWVYKRSE